MKLRNANKHLMPNSLFFHTLQHTLLHTYVLKHTECNEKLESIRFKADFRVPCGENNQLWGWKFQGDSDRTQPANVLRVHQHQQQRQQQQQQPPPPPPPPQPPPPPPGRPNLTSKSKRMKYPLQSTEQVSVPNKNARRRPSVTAKRVKPPLSLPSNIRIQNKKYGDSWQQKVWNVLFAAQTILVGTASFSRRLSATPLSSTWLCCTLYAPPLCPLLCATLLSSPLLRSTLLFRSLLSEVSHQNLVPWQYLFHISYSICSCLGIFWRYLMGYASLLQCHLRNFQLAASQAPW